MATFSIVATPIGNLEDITLRALKVIGGADLVACEDTRVTKRLLDRHGLDVRTISYHVHSKVSRLEDIVSLLRQGKNIALVSDAGTPAISDPGSELVAYIRREMKDEISSGLLKIEVIPGASALTSALSLAGIPCSDFIFLGFLPHKKGREKLFKEISLADRTMVFYESPHRIIKTLESLAQVLSDSPKIVTICRELTKIFEETFSGRALEVLNHFSTNKDKIRGEFVVIVSHPAKK